jgi:prephenate dehydratase
MPEAAPDRPRVAFSGEPGAFAEDAVLAAFDSPQAIGVPGFRSVFEAVEGGRLLGDVASEAPIAAGLLPIENLVNGTVRETYDLLLEHRLTIVGEVVVPVRLCLAALPGQQLEDVERVYSHIQALGQAERFLRSRPWTLLTTYNTAGAGRLIVDRAERAAAAVLSPRAAGIFGLEVLVKEIGDEPDNRTRFLVVARPDEPPPGLRSAPGGGEARRRTTLVFGVRNESGALYRCLGIFAQAGLNLSKLESRPNRGRAREYVFWVELDADADAPATAAAIETLGRTAATVRVLGSYPRAAAP